MTRLFLASLLLVACSDGELHLDAGTSPDGSAAVDAGAAADAGAMDSGSGGDEGPVSACADGLDNDGDGLFDFPEDCGCLDADAESEANEGDCDLPIHDFLAGLEPGAFGRVPGTELSQLDPCDTIGICPPGRFRSIVGGWSGAVFDTRRQRLVIFGGGHADYGGEELYAFDLDTLSWQRLTTPSEHPDADQSAEGARLFESCGYYARGPFDVDAVPDADRQRNRSTGELTYLRPELCDQAPYVDLIDWQHPRSRHTYDGLAYVPERDALCAFGAVALYPSGQTSHAWVDCYDFTAERWSRLASPVPEVGSVPGFGGFTQYWSGAVWISGKDSGGRLGRFDATTEAHESYDLNPWGGWRNGKDSVVRESTGELFHIGSGSMLRYDLAAPSAAPTMVASTGDTALVDAVGAAFAYHPRSDRLIGWHGGRAVHAYDFTTNAWTRVDAAGDDPGPATDNGVFGRFQYSARYDVFVGVSSTEADVFLYRPR